jgi:hypothetical protein
VLCVDRRISACPAQEIEPQDWFFVIGSESASDAQSLPTTHPPLSAQRAENKVAENANRSQQDAAGGVNFLSVVSSQATRDTGRHQHFSIDH